MYVRLTIPSIPLEGKCGLCLTWHNLGENWYLPEHKNAEGTRCRHSRYSPSALRNVIRTPQEARVVASFLVQYQGECLQHIHHSMACADGVHCYKRVFMLSNALGTYFLSTAKE